MCPEEKGDRRDKRSALHASINLQQSQASWVPSTYTSSIPLRLEGPEPAVFPCVYVVYSCYLHSAAWGCESPRIEPQPKTTQRKRVSCNYKEIGRNLQQKCFLWHWQKPHFSLFASLLSRNDLSKSEPKKASSADLRVCLLFSSPAALSEGTVGTGSSIDSSPKDIASA
jgi:hypothetical protein